MTNRLQAAKESLGSFVVNAGFMLGMSFAAPTTLKAVEQYATLNIDVVVARHELAGFVGGLFGFAPAFVLVGSAFMSLNPLYVLPIAVGQGASLAAEAVRDRYFSRSQNGQASV
ncbi:MAG: hypothetical protein HYT16_03990 [DPANN group archaeon]|nr:hypothetical protein [DPANN group archaeon]